ncbi:MAG: stage V sporulation protein AC [Oscillospiraceae bacterium]
MKMTNNEYNQYIQKISPPSSMWANMLKAFVAGGLICCVGQAFIFLYDYFGLSQENTATATSITMVFLGALLTGLGLYDRLAKNAGAGTLVPITGFANSIVSPALEFKTEGIVTGMAAKMFVIAGPVLVFGISASVIYGIILLLLDLV